MVTLEYLRDGAEIYRRSFAIIRHETDLRSVPAELEAVVVRMVHACGMVDLTTDLEWSGGCPGVGQAGRDALAGGATIFVDSLMVANGITKTRFPAANPIVCTIGEEATRERADATGTTRAAAAVDGWLPELAGGVVAIGNAPTALFRLLELLAAGGPKPAAILGLPVGFVGAAESKRALAESGCGVPWLTVHGRRGGSALAAAALNALASERE